MASPLQRARAASDQDSCEQVAKPVKRRRVAFEVLQPRWAAHVPLNADVNRLIGSFMLPHEDEVKANFNATMVQLDLMARTRARFLVLGCWAGGHGACLPVHRHLWRYDYESAGTMSFCHNCSLEARETVVATINLDPDFSVFANCGPVQECCLDQDKWSICQYCDRRCPGCCPDCARRLGAGPWDMEPFSQEEVECDSD
jgi:hypothetical protein